MIQQLANSLNVIPKQASYEFLNYETYTLSFTHNKELQQLKLLTKLQHSNFQQQINDDLQIVTFFDKQTMTHPKITQTLIKQHIIHPLLSFILQPPSNHHQHTPNTTNLHPNHPTSFT